MDIFDGSGIYRSLFVFNETLPPNENFPVLGFDNKTFLINTGSYFILLFGIFAFNLLFATLNFIAVLFSRWRLCRKMGMRYYSPDYKGESINEAIKLVLETHFEISMCSVLGMI